MYDPQWDAPILSTTSQNGGGRLVEQLVQPQHEPRLLPVRHEPGRALRRRRRRTACVPSGSTRPAASSRTTRRPVRSRGSNHLGTDMSHGQGPLTTASDLLFVGQIDGRVLAMDAAGGDVLWEFQTGSGIAGAPVTYEVDGEQYVAVIAAGSTNPYAGSVTQGDSLWAFKLGGSYTTESGSQEGPDTKPLSIRRPVGGTAVEGATVANTVLLARTSRTADTAAARDSVSQNGMAADASAGARRHDGDVPQPGGRDVPELPEPEGALRDAVLRGRVQRQAAARRDLPAHVRPCRRVLLQRLHRPAADRKDRGLPHSEGSAGRR